jgi:hypothetical protein
VNAERLKYLATRGLEVIRETGPRGMMRRAARAGLDRTANGLFDLERRLDRVARTMTLTQDERRELRRTASHENGERGRPAFVLGPHAEREHELWTDLGDAVVIASWQRAPVPAAPRPTYLVGSTPPTDRDAFLAAMEAAPTATFLLPLGSFPLDQAPPRVRFFFPTVHASRLRGVTLHPTRFPACADDEQLALTFAILLGCTPISLVGMGYDGLRTPDGGSFPPTGPLPEALPLCLGQEPAKTRYAEAMRRCNRLYEGYRALGEEAARRQLVVRTVDPLSFFDVFPRVSVTAARS